MSIKAVSWALEQYVADPVAKLVLIGIADRYNDERGYAWPSVGWLATAASVSNRTVQRKIKLLEKQGFLATTQIKGETTHYHLFLEGVRPEVTGLLPEVTGGDNLSGVTIRCQGGGDNCVSPKQYNNNNNINKSKGQKQKVSEWKPSEDDLLYASELQVDADEILEGIRLWDEQNGNKAAYVNVSAFWKNWCRREAKRTRAAFKSRTGDVKGEQKTKTISARQEAFIDSLMAKYIRAYRDDDPEMIRDALKEMMAKGLDIEGWYQMGHGLKHHTEF